MANAVHFPSLAAFADVEFAAICDLDAERLRQTADRYGIDRRYTDYRKMVEEAAPDAVYAIGQPHLMYDVWVWCLQQGQNLYIEKPMGLTLPPGPLARVSCGQARLHHPGQFPAARLPHGGSPVGGVSQARPHHPRGL
jgi:hypothetical protein